MWIKFLLSSLSPREAVEVYSSDVINQLDRLIDESQARWHGATTIKNAAIAQAQKAAYERVRSFLMSVDIVD